MSQHDVAVKLDVTDVAVSRWECGRSNPLRKYQERMAAVYGVSVEDIDNLLGFGPDRENINQNTV